MIIFALFFFCFLLFILFVFSSPKLSPIPYFPSHAKDMRLIIRALDLKNEQVVVDLGAGDGAIVFAGATFAHTHNLNTHFIAVEINPFLLVIMHLRRIFHPHRKYMHIVNFNMFSDNLRELVARFHVEKNISTFYMYISPRYLGMMKGRIQTSFSHAHIVTYFYKIPDTVEVEKIQGVHPIYKYK